MSITPFIRACRPINLGMTALMMLGIWFGVLDIAEVSLNSPWFLGYCAYIFSVLCVFYFGYLINDYCDVKTDAINKPGKNIFDTPFAKPAFRLMLSLPVICISIPICFSLIGWGNSPILLNSIACVLLYVYAAKAKNSVLWGNFLIAFLSALLVWAAAFACFPKYPLALRSSYFWLIFFSFFSFLGTLVREIVKDAEDEEGDRLAGLKTLATTYGLKTARQISTLFMGLLLLSLLIAIYTLAEKRDIVLVLLTSLVVLVAFLFFKLSQAKHKRDFKNISLGLKLMLVLGIILMFI